MIFESTLTFVKEVNRLAFLDELRGYLACYIANLSVLTGGC